MKQKDFLLALIFTLLIVGGFLLATSTTDKTPEKKEIPNSPVLRRM